MRSEIKLYCHDPLDSSRRLPTPRSVIIREPRQRLDDEDSDGSGSGWIDKSFWTLSALENWKEVDRNIYWWVPWGITEDTDQLSLSLSLVVLLLLLLFGHPWMNVLVYTWITACAFSANCSSLTDNSAMVLMMSCARDVEPRTRLRPLFHYYY